MHKSKWIELQCLACKKLDRMPLVQFQNYELYVCPYERNGSKCCGEMKILQIRELEFAYPKQPQLFLN